MRKQYKKERKSNRLQGFDYSAHALYFITTCVQDRVCCFGEIIEQKMICNNCGKIAEMQWAWLQKQYPYVVSHAFAVMPNHIHAVFQINRMAVTEYSSVESDSEILWDDFPVDSWTFAVGTGRNLSLPQMSENQPAQQKIKSLSELIGAYKSTTSKIIHETGYTAFQWQRSFHDHIIHDKSVYEKIINYIANNPKNWEEDMFYS